MQLFARDGEDATRVSTPVRKLDRERAVGTPLGHSQPAYTDALQGHTHVDLARQSLEQITSTNAHAVNRFKNWF